MSNVFELSPSSVDALIADLDLVDPTDPGRIDDKRPAPRLHSLIGARVALLENRKPKARELLEELGRLLVERGGVSAANLHSKFIYSRPAAVEIVDELAGYDAVVTAIGD
jgi:hypothetical protein